ncbi:TPA: hypothetical protein PPN70_004781 [Serratia rubidaea]|nr:hypothetical protein [Serratia rubidaea]HDJ1446719.1 hypothetical protein [Serratia rubidaea]HDJ1464161.1 hypothetical protein [Serratia rubidaea]HDJ2774626.1 hypothetical protein [Serratia rubidaea]
MSQQYTNELTPEILDGMDHSPFTSEQLAEMSGEARALIEEQEAFCRVHPVTAIYRIAVAGCLTDRGGIGDEFNPNPEEGSKIRLENGQWVSVLTEDCTVTYPDGSSARIVSSAGSQHAYEGRGIALVGSLLSNGDRIISTPQSASMLIERDGVPMGEDFLTTGHE